MSVQPLAISAWQVWKCIFINWKTGCQSREPAKELGWFFQLALEKNIGMTCPT